MADHNIYCEAIGDVVRVELAESYLDVRNNVLLLTIETNEGTFFSVNPSKIIAINWAVKIAEDDYRIRLFLTDAVTDIDPLKQVNRIFYLRYSVGTSGKSI